jgi:hypothetical protein
MLTIGSSTIGLALSDRVDRGLASGGDEGDFLAVDGMGLAVVHRHAQVLQGEPGHHALGQRLATTPRSTAGHEDARNGTRP